MDFTNKYFLTILFIIIFLILSYIIYSTQKHKYKKNSDKSDLYAMSIIPSLIMSLITIYCLQYFFCYKKTNRLYLNEDFEY